MCATLLKLRTLIQILFVHTFALTSVPITVCGGPSHRCDCVCKVFMHASLCDTSIIVLEESTNAQKTSSTLLQKHCRNSHVRSIRLVGFHLFPVVKLLTSTRTLEENCQSHKFSMKYNFRNRRCMENRCNQWSRWVEGPNHCRRYGSCCPSQSQGLEVRIPWWPPGNQTFGLIYVLTCKYSFFGKWFCFQKNG